MLNPLHALQQGFLNRRWKVRQFYNRLMLILWRVGLWRVAAPLYLILTTWGRKTRQPRPTVLMYQAVRGQIYILALWGTQSDWYRNVMANPRVAVQVGNHKFDATAERLAPEEGARIMLSYAREHPQALRMLAQMMNYPLDGSEESAQEFGRMIPVLAFRPVSGVSAPDKALQ